MRTILLTLLAALLLSAAPIHSQRDINPCGNNWPPVSPCPGSGQ